MARIMRTQPRKAAPVKGAVSQHSTAQPAQSNGAPPGSGFALALEQNWLAPQPSSDGLGHIRAHLHQQLSRILSHTRAGLFMAAVPDLHALAFGLSQFRYHPDSAWARDYCKVCASVCEERACLTVFGAMGQVVQSKMGAMETWQLASIAHSLARLGCKPSAYWLATLRDLTATQLEQLSSKQVASFLWTWATWGVDPGAMLLSTVL